MNCHVNAIAGRSAVYRFLRASFYNTRPPVASARKGGRGLKEVGLQICWFGTTDAEFVVGHHDEGALPCFDRFAFKDGMNPMGQCVAAGSPKPNQ